MAGLAGYTPPTKDNVDGISAVQQGAQTTPYPSNGVAQGSPTESLMGSAVDHDSPMYGTVAGIANGLEGPNATIGSDIIAMSGSF